MRREARVAVLIALVAGLWLATADGPRPPSPTPPPTRSAGESAPPTVPPTAEVREVDVGASDPRDPMAAGLDARLAHGPRNDP
jgi:hypothetical protein